MEVRQFIIKTKDISKTLTLLYSFGWDLISSENYQEYVKERNKLNKVTFNILEVRKESDCIDEKIINLLCFQEKIIKSKREIKKSITIFFIVLTFFLLKCFYFNYKWIIVFFLILFLVGLNIFKKGFQRSRRIKYKTKIKNYPKEHKNKELAFNGIDEIYADIINSCRVYYGTAVDVDLINEYCLLLKANEQKSKCI